MWRIPTTTVDVHRGTATSDDADEVDTVGAVVIAGLRFSLIEQERAVGRHDSGMPRIVRSVTGAAPAGTDIRVGDRVKDLSTGLFYSVDATRQPGRPSFVPPADLVINLRRVSL
jgi:hypothetical protein